MNVFRIWYEKQPVSHDKVRTIHPVCTLQNFRGYTTNVNMYGIFLSMEVVPMFTPLYSRISIIHTVTKRVVHWLIKAVSCQWRCMSIWGLYPRIRWAFDSFFCSSEWQRGPPAIQLWNSPYDLRCNRGLAQHKFELWFNFTRKQSSSELRKLNSTEHFFVPSTNKWNSRC